ncbi:hypothetical protein MANY_10970 [Mycolicibacterium anyangense]|uniref:Uncharacterized protein n=1 Tax=Mycolicibacterium anyangense TaxID=1431246 RepID=A0A6N4W1L2_9MYCO|nr:hypothetical protein [Mycolicibacterium anyangense]BBZ75760.1 hypothetical protein MANY_10970 [Mycolicibacterium anyangense]
MTLTVADIERWNADDVREVFHAATSRAQATFDAAQGLSTLPAFQTWGGVAAQAAKAAIGKTRQDLDAHGNEALAVADAARSAADNIERIKSELAGLKADAESLGMEIDPISDTVLPGPKVRNPMEAELKQAQLQPRLDKIVAEANLVDMALANAINMAAGMTRIPSDAPKGASASFGSPPRSLSDVLLPSQSETADPAKESGSHWIPTKTDVLIGTAGAVAGGTADGVRQAALNLINESPGTGPGKADPGLLKWLEDLKVGGVELRGISRVGGAVGAVSAIPAVMSDIHDGNSVPEAVTREAAGTGAALVAGGFFGAVATDAAAGAAIGSVIPGAGTAIGLVVGAVAGAAAAIGVSKLVEDLW